MTTENNSKKEITEAALPVTGNSETKNNAGPGADEVVICDECGDTLWDKVLTQEDEANALNHVCKIPVR